MGFSQTRPHSACSALRLEYALQPRGWVRLPPPPCPSIHTFRIPSAPTSSAPLSRCTPPTHAYFTRPTLPLSLAFRPPPRPFSATVASPHGASVPTAIMPRLIPSCTTTHPSGTRALPRATASSPLPPRQCSFFPCDGTFSPMYTSPHTLHSVPFSVLPPEAPPHLRPPNRPSHRAIRMFFTTAKASPLPPAPAPSLFHALSFIKRMNELSLINIPIMFAPAMEMCQEDVYRYGCAPCKRNACGSTGVHFARCAARLPRPHPPAGPHPNPPDAASEGPADLCQQGGASPNHRGVYPPPPPPVFSPCVPPPPPPLAALQLQLWWGASGGRPTGGRLRAPPGGRGVGGAGVVDPPRDWSFLRCPPALLTPPLPPPA